MIVDVRLCACGSGLRLARCCQMDFSMVPPAEATRPLVPVVQRAAQLHAQGAVEEAEKLALETLELAPSQLDALTLLYQIRKKGGQENAAHILLRRIVELHPNTLWATHELTVALFSRGAIAEAEIHARNAVRIAPENPQSHNLMGMIMTEANRPQIGEYHYRRVIDLARNRDPIVLANLAWNLKNQGRMAEARTLYEEVERRRPQRAADLARLGPHGGGRPQLRAGRRVAGARRTAGAGKCKHRPVARCPVGPHRGLSGGSRGAR